MFGKLFETDGPNRAVRGRHGLFLYNAYDAYIGRSLEKYGEFSEQEVSLLMQICNPGDLVIEVGANIGAHTVPLAKRVGGSGSLLSIEPQAAVFNLLCANLALNNLSNVRPLQMAVGATQGQIRVPQLALDRPQNFGGLSLRQANSGPLVPLVTLDSLFRGNRLRLLKIDVEGMEIDVVRGAARLIRELQPALYVENDRVDQSRALIECIAEFDYELFWHLPPLFQTDNIARDPENIFPGIVSINMLCVPRAAAGGIQGLRRVDDPTFHPAQR